MFFRLFDDLLPTLLGILAENKGDALMHDEMIARKERRGLSARVVLAAALALGIGLSAPVQAESQPVLKALFGGEKPAVANGKVLAPTPQAGFAELVEKVMPAVVSIEVEVSPGLVKKGRELFRNQPWMEQVPPELRRFFRRFFEEFGGPEQFGRPIPRQHPPLFKGRAVGSGFFISSDGYVVTNHHVVKNAEKIWIKTQDGKRHRARLLGSDPKTDLALLKVDAKGKTFPFVEFADAEPRVGEWVIAVGNPFGFGGTVTAGIISAKSRVIGAGPYDDFLQIDAPINKGNSGGPTFNMKGRVVGVNTAIFSPTGGSVGIGFAIPAKVAKKIITELKDKGKVVRGWLGVQIQQVDAEMAEGLGLDEPHGAIVVRVTDDSPAQKAGLRVGDVILRVNDQQVRSPRDLAIKVAAIEPGTSARFLVLRDGERKELQVVIGRMPSDEEIAKAFGKRGEASISPAELGLSLKPAEDGKGVVIAAVDPASKAAEKGLRPGDVVLEVAGVEVNSPAAFATALAKARKKGRKAVLLLVRTAGGDQRFVALPLRK